MIERQVMFTGVGGQGVQIVSRTLAMAAVAEGREVLLVPRYGGMMRGGKTNAELTVCDGPLRALPNLTSAWSALVMDPAFWETIRPNLASGAVVVVNASLFHLEIEVPGTRRLDVAAIEIATELGSPTSAGFVMLGAYIGVTGLVGVASAVEAMREVVPARREQHVAANERAIEAGVAAVPELAHAAWAEAEVAR